MDFKLPKIKKKPKVPKPIIRHENESTEKSRESVEVSTPLNEQGYRKKYESYVSLNLNHSKLEDLVNILNDYINIKWKMIKIDSVKKDVQIIKYHLIDIKTVEEILVEIIHSPK